MKQQDGYCDDGNDNDADGCTQTCEIVSGWTCTGDAENASE